MEEELGVSKGGFDQNTIYACIKSAIKIILKRRVLGYRIWKFKKSIWNENKQTKTSCKRHRLEVHAIEAVE